ncbi:MAG: hypothetical protein V4668_04020 [Patescibacteria group bacterium]
MNIQEICEGADPFIFKQNDKWHLLVQSDLSTEPHAHDGIKGYSLRSASSIEELPHSAPTLLTVGSQQENLRQVWAGEIHFDNHMYVAASTGDNTTHRMHVYKTHDTALGPWEHVGKLKTLDEDDGWMIDLTFAFINVDGEMKPYAFWSGWETTPESDFHCNGKVVPQHIYAAPCISPTEIGKRVLIATPSDKWANSHEPILEGPQALYMDNTFRGLVLCGNASWTRQYATNFLKYKGGDPLSPTSWTMASNPLFRYKKGIGHGMIIEDKNNWYYVGHYKTQQKKGWEDRRIFFSKLSPHYRRKLH